jgi:hypothetical protein
MSSVKLRREAFQSTLERVSLTKGEGELVRKLIGDRAFTRVVRWNAILQFDECES